MGRMAVGRFHKAVVELLHKVAAYHSIRAVLQFAAAVVDNRRLAAADNQVAADLGSKLVVVATVLDLDRTFVVVRFDLGNTPVVDSDHTLAVGTARALADAPQLFDVSQSAVDDRHIHNTSYTSNNSQNTSTFGKGNRLHLENKMLILTLPMRFFSVSYRRRYTW